MDYVYVLNHEDRSMEFVSAFSYRLRDHIIQWLEENIGNGRWRYDWDTFGDPELSFSTEEDFIAFKLRWL